jgi:hypothetical protein
MRKASMSIFRLSGGPSFSSSSDIFSDGRRERPPEASLNFPSFRERRRG